MPDNTMQASTPHRTTMSALNSPSKSPSRRVLGDLPAKPVNTPSKQINSRDGSETMRSYSPIKQVPTLSPQLLMNKENTVGVNAWNAGRKRSIYEVDDAEDVAMAKAMFGGRGGAGVDMPIAPMGVPLEGHFSTGIATNPESIEMGSPTEPDTATPEPEEDPMASQQSFSEYLKFPSQQEDASQTAAADEEPEPVVKNEQRCKPEQAEESVTTGTQTPKAAPAGARKSRAELLRLRLGFGYYKVKTDQVDKSSNEIITEWANTSPDSSLLQSTSTTFSSTGTNASALSIPDVVVSAPRRDSVSHVVANIDPSDKYPKLSLFGGPVLKPTMYSSRKIQYDSLASSPPSASIVPTTCSPEQLMSPTRTKSNYQTPVPKRMKTAEEEACSDEEMEMGEAIDELREGRFLQLDRPELTSSVVKKSAAHGLLELMSSRP